MNKELNNKNKPFDATILFDRIITELGVTNVKAIGFVKSNWIVRYFKGRQNKFDSFDSMYIFLKTENNEPSKKIDGRKK